MTEQTDHSTNQITFNENEMFHLFKTLFDIVFLLKYVKPMDFQYIKISDSAKELSKLTDDDIGKTISQLYNDHMAKHLNAHYFEAVQKKAPITYRDRIDSNNDEKYGETVLLPFLHNGEWFVVGLTRDITHIVRLEKRLANDPITGLPFAENFTSTLSEKLRLKQYEGSIWSLFYISITQLSFIQYSNQATETTILRKIANRLQRFLKA